MIRHILRRMQDMPKFPAVLHGAADWFSWLATEIHCATASLVALAGLPRHVDAIETLAAEVANLRELRRSVAEVSAAMHGSSSSRPNSTAAHAPDCQLSDPRFIMALPGSCLIIESHGALFFAQKFADATTVQSDGLYWSAVQP